MTTSHLLRAGLLISISFSAGCASGGSSDDAGVDAAVVDTGTVDAASMDFGSADAATDAQVTDSSVADAFTTDTALPIDAAIDAAVDSGPAAVPQIIFASGGLWQGGLSATSSVSGTPGIEAADHLCSAIAMELSIGSGNFRAWLSDPIAGNAIDRMAGDGPWVNMRGEVVFADRAAFTSSGPAVSMGYDESGNEIMAGHDGIPGTMAIWTGTAPGGTATTDHCANWTVSTNDTNGIIGDLGSLTISWSNAMSITCTNAAHILCVEQR